MRGKTSMIGKQTLLELYTLFNGCRINARDGRLDPLGWSGCSSNTDKVELNLQSNLHRLESHKMWRKLQVNSAALLKNQWITSFLYAIKNYGERFWHGGVYNG